jgi:D-glycero-D-manno-heptose 1,7-bisphosphate phosphatase
LRLVVVTNQPDVARGTQTRERVAEINQHLLANLPILAVLTCYHDNSDGCGCRKPLPGMLTTAAARFALDLRDSFMVGDRWSDVVAGSAAGCLSVLIERDYSRRELCKPHHCANDLQQAAAWILRLFKERQA